MPSVRGSFGEVRVVKIVGWAMGHANSLHDAARPLIADGRKGNQLVEEELLESELQDRSGGFGCVAVSPMFVGQAPADLDARGEMGLKGRLAQPNKSDESRNADHFDRPEAIAVAVKFFPNAARHRIAFRWRQGLWKMLHHARVGVDRGKRRQVVVGPRAEAQSRRVDHRRGLLGERT
jgi:hypothetical protein